MLTCRAGCARCWHNTGTMRCIRWICLPRTRLNKDRVINQISLDDQRVVISKDTDFFYSHLHQGRPWKLLLVRTGNISTRDLCALFERNLPTIEAALQSHTLVEIDRLAVTPVV